MFNPPLIKDLTYNSVDRYSQKAIENTLLVTINSASKTINENGQPEQIINLPDSYEKNIVIITQNPPSDYPDDERRLFFDCIKRAQQNGKNVFVVYEAQTTQTYVEDGIVYITCAVVTGEDFGKSNVEVGVEFYLLGGELNYAFIN